MKLRTEIEAIAGSGEFGHQHQYFTIGSCFAACMGQRLKERGYPTMANPFGTIYNPLSVACLLEEQDTSWLDPFYVERDGMWYNYQLHSQLHAPTRKQLERMADDLIQDTVHWLNETDVLIITLGTAMVWQLESTNSTVANCHKMPNEQFSQRLLEVQEIVEALGNAITTIQRYNPKLQVILSVSPVRHTRQTLAVNSLSKAILRMACHQLDQVLEWCHYFPAYELMMDDLRDYRFYNDDLIHPTTLAEDYIWQHFKKAWLQPSSFAPAKQYKGLLQNLAHKPLQQNQEAQERNLYRWLKEAKELNSTVPTEELIAQIKDRLQALKSAPQQEVIADANVPDAEGAEVVNTNKVVAEEGSTPAPVEQIHAAANVSEAEEEDSTTMAEVEAEAVLSNEKESAPVEQVAVTSHHQKDERHKKPKKKAAPALLQLVQALETPAVETAKNAPKRVKKAVNPDIATPVAVGPAAEPSEATAVTSTGEAAAAQSSSTIKKPKPQRPVKSKQKTPSMPAITVGANANPELLAQRTQFGKVKILPVHQAPEIPAPVAPVEPVKAQPAKDVKPTPTKGGKKIISAKAFKRK